MTTPRVENDSVSAWVDAMGSGNFAAAWRISDRILDEHKHADPPWHLPRHEQWLWDGRPLQNRRVLVRCYHGLGDTLQFARFIPRLARIAARVVVWTQPVLVNLLQSLQCDITVLPLHDGDPAVAHDVDVEIMELAHALRISPQELGDSVPYFHVQSEPPRDGRFGVGVVLDAGNWNARRSMPRAALGELDPRLDWFSLQPDRPLAGMIDASTPDICELAARLQALDLVIAVDTMIAHLAGALGVPTWTLLPFEADWRWQRDRSDTPWYPSMRLMRQARPDDWTNVGAMVRSNLRCLP